MKIGYRSRKFFRCAVLAALILAVLSQPDVARADAADDLKAGQQAMAKGDLTAALNTLKSAAEALPQSVEAQLALAECHLKLGQLPEALSQYRKVLKLSPEHAAAKQVVAALSGKQRSFDESLSQAQSLVDVGAFQAAEQMLAAAILQPVSKEQRHTAQLLLAEVRLWNGNHNGALIDSLQLAEESSDAKIVGPARVIAALATLSLGDSFEAKNTAAEKAAGLLPKVSDKPGDANALPQVWQTRAILVRARAALTDATAAKYSAELAEGLKSLPDSAFRAQFILRAWNQLYALAESRLNAGDTEGMLAIVWPMVAAEPLPGKEVAGKPIKISGGWLRFDGGELQDRLHLVTELLQTASARELQLAGAEASLREIWLAAELWREHALEDASALRLELAQALAGWTRVDLDRKPGTSLSRADELQFTILMQDAGKLTTEAQRDLVADLVVGQVQRYAVANDLAAGLAKMIVVQAEPFEVQLAAGLRELLSGSARQKLLLGLANQAAVLGAKQFAEATATLAPTANQSLQRDDQIALRLLGQVWHDAHTAQQTDQATAASQAAESIIGRYSAANRWQAALAAAELFHRGDDTVAGRFAQLRLQLRQALSVQDRQLASHMGLGAELAPDIKEILTATAKLIKDRADDASKSAVLQLAGILVQRYQQLDRPDLALAVIGALAGDAAVGDRLQDWALWARASIQLGQADSALALAATRFRGGKGLPLLEQHKAGLVVLDDLISKHAKSPYFANAVDRYLAVANRYEQYGSYDTAQAVLTAFLEKHGKLTVAQRVQFVLVQTLVLKAKTDFDEQQQAKKNAEPPQALIPSHTAVLNALADFLKQYPTGDYVTGGEAIFFDIARLYGQQGAWPVVRGVLTRYATAFPNFGSPEHLKLLEAATYLGELDRDYGLSLLTPPSSPQGVTNLDALREIGRDSERERGVVTTIVGNGRDDDLVFEAPANGAKPAGEGKRIADMPAIDPFAAAPEAMSLSEPNLSGAAPGYGPAGRVEWGGFAPTPYPTSPSYGNQPRPDSGALAVIRQSQQRQSQQIAMLDQQNEQLNQPPQQTVQQQGGVMLPSGAMLSEAELKRQNTAAEKAYALLIELAKLVSPSQVSVSQQARTQIFWLFGFLEGQGRPERAAEWIVRFLDDRPDDPERVPLAYRALEDRLAYASLVTAKDQAVGQQNQAWFEARHARFEQARAAMETFVKEFADERNWADQARLLKVSSYEQEASLARGYSAVRSGGLYVQAATALLNLLEVAPEHAEASNFPARLWNLADQLQSLSQQDQAIYVLSQIPHRFPTNDLATQAVFRIASLYAADLHNPLKAVETYQEYLSLNGDDENVRSQIFSIAGQLANGQRYLEALHVFGVFVDSFPNDPRAAEALRQIGQTHQANEAWQEALAAYQRILDEFPNQSLIPQVKLAIAECHINLSGWREARRLYEEFLEQFPQEGQAGLAKSRIDILKNLERYQTLLADKEVERNKDDAQFQIGRIVREQLHNSVKAVEEFKKVVSGYPGSDLADDAQLETGRALLDLGRQEEARVALLQVPEKHPDSPLSDDALYLVAQSYEQQAQRLGAVTVAQVRSEAYEQGQRGAYLDFNRLQAQVLEQQRDRRSQLKKAGKSEELALDEAVNASRLNLNVDNIFNSSRQAEVVAECEIALQVANRQDRINDALREAVELYNRVAKDHPLGDKTDDALLRIAVILETELKDRAAAMETYQKIVKLFPGTPVAEDAAWKVAKFYEQEGKYAAAAVGLRDFIRNYPASQRVADAQYSLAEVYEQLGRWVDAMDAYETFRQKFGKHPKSQVAQEQINWIKAYRK